MKRPAPYQSPLWDHLDTIRSMRRGRKSWQEIANRLETDHGLKTDYSTICNFLRRVNKRKKPPIGFEDPPPTDPPTESEKPKAHTPPDPDIHAKKEESDDERVQAAYESASKNIQPPKPKILD